LIRDHRILFLSPFSSWPLLNGSIVRSHYLAKYLAVSNTIWFAHRENSIPYPKKLAYTSFPATSNRLDQIFNLSIFIRYIKLIWEQGIDTILISHLWSGLYGILLKAFTGKQLVFDNHNVEVLRFRSSGNSIFPAIGIFEWLVCRAADQIWCVSTADKTKLMERYHLQEQKLQVVPNGAEVEELRQYAVDRKQIRTEIGIHLDEVLILFYGQLSYAPNRQAIGVIMEHLLPSLLAAGFSFKLVIAGQGGREYQKASGIYDPHILFTGYLDDLVALIKSADLMIVPITSGSGTRIKIIETIACGIPVISTTEGAEGLDRDAAGEMLTVCDGWENFARQIITQVISLTSAATPERFYQIYDWKNIVESIRLD